jgi:6-phosphogluconolactonase
MGRRFASAGAVLRHRRRLVVIAAAAVCGVLWLAPSGPAESNSDGTVYVQTNTAPVNYVLAFDRSHDGTLGAPVRYATLGVGKPAANPPLGIPFLDSSGSVTLSDNGQFLFVVNAGDNTVSSFRVGPHGLELADIIPTFGSRPVSASSHDHLLYVLNSDTGDASISGYRVDEDGGLTPIAGSHRPTTQPVGGMPAQVQFDTTGRFLTVSERLAGPKGVIDTYAVGRNGAAGPPVGHPSSDNGPFGIAFTKDDLMIVSNEHFPDVFPPGPVLSSVSSYDFSRNGAVTPIDTELAHAGGACWNAITNDGKFVFVTSPFTHNVNSFGIKKNGNLVPVNGTSVIATTTGLALDEALSHDSKYLYVLDSAGFASSAVDEYKVNKDGTITKIGTSASFEGSAAGAAGW